MSEMNRAWRAFWLLSFLLLIMAFSTGAWWLAYRTALDRLSERTDVDLILASDRLTRHLLRYRELAVVLSEHPALSELLEQKGDRARADELLQSMADKTGATSIELVDPQGQVLAGATHGRQDRRSNEMPIARALNGALGTDNFVEIGHSGLPQRLFSFAAPVYDDAGPPAGALVVRADVWAFEQIWPTSAAAIFFVDGAGRVFVSNRSELVLAERWSDEGFVPFRSIAAWTGHDIWALEGGPYLPARALHLSRDLPVIGMTGSILVDTAPAMASALLQAAVVAALCLVFGAVLFFAAYRRRALTEKLAIEAAANARLESRVAERTHALSEANVSLRREVKERQDAEAALKQAQSDLVRAGKLSALGKMSAGISHELNQPLMAIRSFAENGEAFLDRGDPGKARANLARISELARRMDRIIRNLRAFARQERAPIGDVDLTQVVEAAVEICEGRLGQSGVTLSWHAPGTPVMVRGGEVRLQQVLVNLISNAADAIAMAASPERRIEIGMVREGSKVILSVRDSGPGIEEPERVFDPFYSTKQVGESEGMGLGLSISYGVVQSFGGAIQGQNHPDGGAVFTVELVSAGAALEAAE